MVGHMKLQRNNKGFTLIELLLSMAVFSFVLGICVTVFIQINRLYYRGISITRAQESARNIVDEVKLGLQTGNFAQTSPNPADDLYPAPATDPVRNNIPQKYYCIGDFVYYYKLGARGRDLPKTGPGYNANLGGQHVLARWTQPGFCNAIPNKDTFTIPANAVDLVDDNTTIHQFKVDTGKVLLTISYGGFNQLEPATIDTTTRVSPGVSCRGGVQVVFCGVSTVEAEVTRRTR